MQRVNLFCGHYGSGKTNIAVNYAMHLKQQGLSVAIADLDIVNPYFRTKDSEDELKAAGIDVISLPFANSSVDLPAIPSQAYALFQNKLRYAVLDIGGDDRGAYALGRFAHYILEENNFSNFYVANFCRPLTRTAEEALEVMREIESASSVPFTAIVNNSNIGEETTPELVEKSREEAEKLGKLCGLPIAMTTVDIRIADNMDSEVFPLKLQKKYW